MESLTNELRKQLKAEVFDVLGCAMVVHQELGCGLNEYVYQDALEVLFNEKNIPHKREFHFNIKYHEVLLKHDHFMDFYIRDKICLECKAVTELQLAHRQQLWNYMRLTNTPIGILYNFAPPVDQSEKYYYDIATKRIVAF